MAEYKCEACETILKGGHVGIYKRDISLESGCPAMGIRYVTVVYCAKNPQCKTTVMQPRIRSKK